MMRIRKDRETGADTYEVFNERGVLWFSVKLGSEMSETINPHTYARFYSVVEVQQHCPSEDMMVFKGGLKQAYDLALELDKIADIRRRQELRDPLPGLPERNLVHPFPER